MGVLLKMRSSIGAQRARLRYTTALLRDNPRLVFAPVVHHAGIQRSGTNYLRTLLEGSFGVRVSNAVDPSRDHPRHKHFRVQSNMSTVVMDHAYRHGHAFDKIDGYIQAVAPRLGPKPETCVVIYKDPVNWLESIIRWGIRCHWVSNEEDVLRTDLWRTWIGEYRAYYERWHAFEQAEPSRVKLLQYEALILDREATMTALADFLGRNMVGSRTNVVSQVAQSDKRNLDRLESDCTSTHLSQSLVESVYALIGDAQLGVHYHG